MYKNRYPISGFRICIDDYELEMKGRLYSPLWIGQVDFNDINQLLLKVDATYDDIGYPQAFQVKRSFNKGEKNTNGYKGIPTPVSKVEDILKEQGKLKSFDVVVTTRRNTSWQGYIEESGSGKRRNFNGEIELINFLAKSFGHKYGENEKVK